MYMYTLTFKIFIFFLLSFFQSIFFYILSYLRCWLFSLLLFMVAVVVVVVVTVAPPPPFDRPGGGCCSTIWLMAGGGAWCWCCVTVTGMAIIGVISCTLWSSGKSCSQWCSPHILHSYMFGWIVFFNFYIKSNLLRKEEKKNQKIKYLQESVTLSSNNINNCIGRYANERNGRNGPADAVRPSRIRVVAIVISWRRIIDQAKYPQTLYTGLKESRM